MKDTYKRWDRLSRHEDRYAQCPVTILHSNISDKALRLYLVLWAEAFFHKRYNDKGQQYVEMSYEDVRKAVRCSNNKVKVLINELKDNRLISVERKIKNRFTFMRKDDWFKEK